MLEAANLDTRIVIVRCKAHQFTVEAMFCVDNETGRFLPHQPVVRSLVRATTVKADLGASGARCGASK